MLKQLFNLLSGPSEKPFNEQAALSKLRSYLFSCTYHPNIKFLIQQICLSILKNHSQFDIQMLAFSNLSSQNIAQNNQPRRFIQIGGKFSYTHNNKKHQVKVFMMFNQFFPNKPPYLRIVNSQNKPVNQYYSSYQSPNDFNSYVLNPKLNNLVSWTPGKQIQTIFAELKALLEMHSLYVDDSVDNKKPQKKIFLFKKDELKPNNDQYIANRGSSYQSSIQEEKPKQTQTEQGYDQKQCKLCFSNQSVMINLSCGHIMMCQPCFEAYKKKCGSDQCPCPICKTKGGYMRLKYA